MVELITATGFVEHVLLCKMWLWELKSSETFIQEEFKNAIILPLFEVVFGAKVVAAAAPFLQHVPVKPALQVHPVAWGTPSL